MHTGLNVSTLSHPRLAQFSRGSKPDFRSCGFTASYLFEMFSTTMEKCCYMLIFANECAVLIESFEKRFKCKWDSGKDECTVAVKTIQNHIKRHLQFCKKARPHVATPPIGYNLYYNSSCAKPVCLAEINVKLKNVLITF